MAERNAGNTGPLPRLVFSTDQLPAGLDDNARFRSWRALEERLLGSAEVTYARDRPFWARAEAAQVRTVGLVRLAVAFTKVERTARSIAADGRDGFLLGLNWSPAQICQAQRGREALVAPGAASLISQSEAAKAELAPGTGMFMVALPRGLLLERVVNAEDLVVRPVDPHQPALRHLRRYLDILLAPEEVADDALLAAHVETTLLDLTALALGAGRDAAEVAAMRGLRAARLHAVLAEIKANFSNPGFSARDVAARLGLSPRYVQNLLVETGRSFSERVLELRLQKARAILASPRYAGTQVSQIAYLCGFSQVSYFNRCFRRRFGAPPSEARNGARSV